MKTSLHEIGRFDDRLSFLYIDRAIIRHTTNAIAIHEYDGVTDVPVSCLATLMLGPGTKITHEAIKSLADNNCLVIWSGEFGIRFYACGMGGSRHSRNTLKQARLALDERARLPVVIRMYCARFEDDQIDYAITLQQLRGKKAYVSARHMPKRRRHTALNGTGETITAKNGLPVIPSIGPCLQRMHVCMDWSMRQSFRPGTRRQSGSSTAASSCRSCMTSPTCTKWN